MVMNLLRRVKQVINTRVQALRQHIPARTKPTNTALLRGSLQDLARTKPQLIAENALLRQQLIVLNRSVKRPRLTAPDRSLLVLLASRVQACFRFNSSKSSSNKPRPAGFMDSVVSTSTMRRSIISISTGRAARPFLKTRG